MLGTLAALIKSVWIDCLVECSAFRLKFAQEERWIEDYDVIRLRVILLEYLRIRDVAH